MRNGGLKKSVSRLAIIAAAGVISSSAMAANLGGDCCADLEERVAELEATTARKGNRQVSLTISGVVNRMIMHYRDGANDLQDATIIGGVAPGLTRNSNTFWGIDNTNTSSRFNLTGSARINPTVTAGFNMTIEVGSGARSVTVRQDRAEAGTTPGNIGTGDLNDHSLFMRDANVWLASTQLGRLTLGRLTNTGPTGTIDLGGIGVIAPGTILVGNGLVHANPAGVYPGPGNSIGNYYDAAGNYNKRIDGIRYDSPSLAGFQLGATYGEASRTNPIASAGDLGQAHSVNLRYAGEFSGVRVAAGVGYERVNQDSIMGVNAAGTAGRGLFNNRMIGASLSLMHVPTGLFAQGGYTQHRLTGTIRSGNHWHVAAGIAQNWFGIGNTALYGEYGRASNMLRVNAAPTVAAGALSTGAFWGVGVVQHINAAAMQVYLGYRNHSASFNGVSQRDISIISGGARIAF